MRVRAYSAVHLHAGQSLKINVPDSDTEIVVSSEHATAQDGHSYPVTLRVDMTGTADSLNTAQDKLGPLATWLLPIAALGGNAAVVDPMPAFACDIGNGREKRFIAYSNPPPGEWLPVVPRYLSASALGDLAHSVATHRQRTLLHRAIENYDRVLQHWRPENMLLASEFLYMAAEVLGRAMIEERSAELGITPKNLARKHGKQDDVDGLRAKLVIEDVFAGDEALFNDLRNGSDGFEHGYMPTSEVRAKFARLGEAVAAVRTALLSEIRGVDDHSALNQHRVPQGLARAKFVQYGNMYIDNPDHSLDQWRALDFVFPDPTVAVLAAANGHIRLEAPTRLETRGGPAGLRVEITGSALRLSEELGTLRQPLSDSGTGWFSAGS